MTDATTTAATTTPGTDATTQTTQTATTTAATNWVDALPDTVKGFALNKGWDKPEKAVESYRQLESFVGADKAGRGVVIPNDDATPEERSAFFGRLGRPETPEGYAIKAPAGFENPEYLTEVAKTFHSIGLTSAQANAIVAFQNQTAEKFRAMAVAEKAELTQEWGADNSKNIDLSKRGAKALGLSEAQIDLMEQQPAIGFKSVMNMLKTAGEKFGEGRFVDGGSSAGFGDSLEHINAQMADLSKDKAFGLDFSDSKRSGHAAARERWRVLGEKKAALLKAG